MNTKFLCCLGVLAGSFGSLAFVEKPKVFMEEPQNQGTLTIEVTGVENAKGRVLLALYSNASAFPSKDKLATATLSVPAQKGKTILTLKNIPFNTYAISLFHDENSNGKIDTGLMGIPKENYGFSNNPNSKFGPPSFKEASFAFNKVSQTLEIKLK